jgi:uracil phosphoribosyltransferase
MSLQRIEHPLISDILVELRSRETSSEDFRRLTRRITALLVFEATRDLPTLETKVTTPLETSSGRRLATEVVLVPVLRAGMGMLETLLEFLPRASVGYVGLERDETTAVAHRYYSKLPPGLAEQHVLLLDPMLATGGSAWAAIEILKERGASRIRLISVVAAPEGIALLAERCPDVDIYTAAVDRELNPQKYILPGLGDFGDRLYGT